MHVNAELVIGDDASQSKTGWVGVMFRVLGTDANH
jgi:hypothetical protein